MGSHGGATAEGQVEAPASPGVTVASHGNAIGNGMAGFTTARLLAAVDR
jgi:hypothetical protein